MRLREISCFLITVMVGRLDHNSGSVVAVCSMSQIPIDRFLSLMMTKYTLNILTL